MRRVQPASPSKYSDLKRLSLFLVGAMLGAAIFSVPLYLGCQELLKACRITAANARSWPMSEVVKADFNRFFDRALLVSVLAGLPFLVRASRGGPVLPPLRPDARTMGQTGAGFALAAGLILVLGWVYCRTGIYELNPKASWTALGQPLTAAFGAAIVEEILFRGFILGLMLRSLGTRTAVFATTFIFAIVHFLKPPEGFAIPAGEITWHSGFDVIAAIFGRFDSIDFVLAEFFTLFAVGWVAAWARVKTGSLWPGAGLHAGWVFGLKYFSALTLTSKALRDGDYLPWIGDNLKVGLVPFVVVLFTGWLASLGWQRARRS